MRRWTCARVSTNFCLRTQYLQWPALGFQLDKLVDDFDLSQRKINLSIIHEYLTYFLKTHADAFYQNDTESDGYTLDNLRFEVQL